MTEKLYSIFKQNFLLFLQVFQIEMRWFCTAGHETFSFAPIHWVFDIDRLFQKYIVA